jgi:transposase
VRRGQCRNTPDLGHAARAGDVRLRDIECTALKQIEVDPVWWSPSGFSEEASQMPKTRPPYAPEFRRQMVELVRAGRDPAELAREFEPTAQSISHWVAQADRQEGRREEKGNGLSAAEREELARLRRENKQLRLERDILSRAAAWFARETGAIPPGSSNS